MVDRTIADEFYIVQTRPQWYQLRLTFNMECIATAISLEGILERLQVIAERHEDSDTLRRAWRTTDFKPPSEATETFNEKQFKEHKDDFRSEIEKVIHDMTQVNLHLNNKKKLKKKTLNVKHNAPKINVEDTPVKHDALKYKSLSVKPKKKILSKKPNRLKLK